MHFRKLSVVGIKRLEGRHALLLLSLVMLYCGGEPSAISKPDLPVEELSLSPSNAQCAQGTAQQFQLRSLAPSGLLREVTREARWSVAVEGGEPVAGPVEGLLQLGKPGRYRVSAEYGGRRLETVLRVTAATLTGLAVSPSAPQVAKGLSQAFAATAHFSDGTTQDVTRLASWSVKSVMGTGVAVINSLGVAETKNVGKARITAHYLTGSDSTVLEVTAALALVVAISPSNPSIAKGSTQAFAATATYTDGTVQDVTADADWAVADVLGSGVASIDDTGVAAGLLVGQAKVSASYEGQSAETKLTVTAVTLVAVAVSPTEAVVAKGTTQAFHATALFSDGSSQDVTATGGWTATDVMGSGVASIDSRGVAAGTGVGSAAIQCSYRGYVGTATMQVTPAALVALTMQPASASIAKGLTRPFNVVGAYSDGSHQDLTALAAWTTADVMGTNVASVSGTGLVTGKSVGKATVRATYLGNSAVGSLTVTAAMLTALSIAPVAPVITKGTAQQFTALGSFSDGTTQDLTRLASWTATDIAPASGVATVSAGGLAAGLQAGQATIAAQYLGMRDSTVLTVKSPVGPITGGRCLSGASGAAALRVHWTNSAGTAVVNDDVQGLPDKTRSKVGAYGYTAGFVPQFVDHFLGGGLQLDDNDFIDVELSTVGVHHITSITLALFGRSYSTAANGSFHWMTYVGEGSTATDYVSNTVPYQWYPADATAAINPDDGSVLIRIKAGGSSDSLVVQGLELCIDAS